MNHRIAFTWYEIGAWCFGLALYLGLTCYQIELPGLHYDEAIEVLPAMQMLLGQPVQAYRDAGLPIGRFFFPLMTMDYIGAMNTYLSLPFLALFGVRVSAIRIMPILFSALTLLLTGLAARRLYGRAAGIITLLTMAASISFVFWSRQGIFVTNLTATIMMGMGLCGLTWWRGVGSRYLYGAGFLAGLGLYTKLIFVWAIVAFGGAFILLQLDRIIAWVRRRGPAPWPKTTSREWLTALGATIIPLIPFAIFNLQTGGTIATFSKNLISSYYGVNNLAFFNNLLTRLDQFAVVLRGSHFWYLGESFENRLWVPALIAVLLLVVAVAVTRRRVTTFEHGWRLALFPFVVMALVLVQSCFTISSLWFTHFAIATPLPPLALAGGLNYVAQRAGRGRLLWPAALTLVAGIVFYDVLADVRYHRVLAASGGYAAHSDAIYRLTDALVDSADGPVVALDWGIQAPVQFLSQGRVAPRELFGYDRLEEPDAGFASRLTPYLADRRTMYVMHPNEQEVYRGRRFAFTQAVQAAGRQERLAGIIYERSGRPAAILVMVD